MDVLMAFFTNGDLFTIDRGEIEGKPPYLLTPLSDMPDVMHLHDFLTVTDGTFILKLALGSSWPPQGQSIQFSPRLFSFLDLF